MAESSRVSIILPAYNVAGTIGQAIQSVLDQTFSSWELLIVDDGSTDVTTQVIAQFNDPRIHYEFQTNKGASAARNRGIALAQGEYLAFLDADDVYQPEKLQNQVGFLDRYPLIGITYSSRIEMDKGGRPLNFFRVPATVDLESFVLSFPFAPTDLLMRHDWIERVGDFDTSFIVNEDRDLYIRLALNGCQCAGVDRFLSYRRLDSGKVFKNLPARMDDMLRALDTAFQDPRCPEDVRRLSDQAHQIIYLSWAYQAAIQEDVDLAKEYFREALHYDLSLLDRNAWKLRESLVHSATRDGGEHAEWLNKVFAGLPSELETVIEHYQWIVARGYLIRGMRDIMWNFLDDGQAHLSRAVELGAEIDETFLQGATSQLLSYENAFGSAATQIMLSNLSLSLQRIGAQPLGHQLVSTFAINKAFESYQECQYGRVIPNMLRAIAHHPGYLTNRGVLAVLFHSMLGILGRQSQRQPEQLAFAEG